MSKSLPTELRQLAKVAYSAEHRPTSCTVCELADLAQQAADRIAELESAIREHRDRWAGQSTETDDALYAVLEGEK